MRWRYLLPRLILVGLCWCFFAVAFDPLLKRTLVSTGESAVGARVEVAELRTTFFPPRLAIGSTAVANRLRPGRNLVEFDTLRLKLRGDALLRKRFVVESGEISGVRIGADRLDDGLLEASHDSDSLDRYSEKLKEAGEQWLDEMLMQAKLKLDPDQLETYRLGKSIQHKWEDRIHSLKSEFRALRPTVTRLEARFKAAKKERDRLRQIDEYLRLVTDVQSLVDEFERLAAETQRLPTEIRADLQSMDQARLNDQDLIQKQVSALGSDPAELTGLLFGERMAGRFRETLSWLETIRRYQKMFSHGKSSQRARGTVVPFPYYERHPRFLVEQLTLSGSCSVDGNDVPFTGTLRGVTSDRAMYQKPCEICVSGAGDVPLHVKTTFKDSSAGLVTLIQFDATDNRKSDTQFGDSASLQLDAVSAQTRLEGSLRLLGDQLSGELSLSQSSVDLRPSGRAVENEVFSRIVTDLVRSVDDLQVTLGVSGTAARPQLRLSSTLAPQLLDGMRSSLSREMERQKLTLASKLNAAASKRLRLVETRLSSQYQKLAAEHAGIFKEAKALHNLVVREDLRDLDPTDIFRRVSESKVVRDHLSGVLR